MAAEEQATSAEQVAPPTEALVITARAAKVMRDQLVKRGTPDAAIRFGISGGGCNGYAYLFQYEDGPPRKNDTVITTEAHGPQGAPGIVRVYVDPKSLLLLRGTRIDFETGIRGHGFRFENPNVKGSCGCGESVTF